MNGEGVTSRSRVVLFEEVHELLDADCVLIGTIAIADETAGDGVRAGVDIERERRECVVFRIDEGADRGVVVIGTSIYPFVMRVALIFFAAAAFVV